MKRKNPGLVIISFIIITTGIFISAITFLFNLFVASFYYLVFAGISLVWMGIVLLDLRTHYNIIGWKKAHAQISFLGDVAVIHSSRWTNVVRGSGPFFFFLSLGLAPWLSPHIFLHEDAFPPVWHLISICVMFPLAGYFLHFFTVSQTITVGRKYFKRELHGLGWRSELESRDPRLEFDLNKYNKIIEFLVANVNYNRTSIFGSKADYFDEKRVPIPDARNVPLDKFLMWLFPEQEDIWRMMIDLICEPQYEAWVPTRRMQNIYSEISKKKEEFRKSIEHK